MAAEPASRRRRTEDEGNNEEEGDQWKFTQTQPESCLLDEDCTPSSDSRSKATGIAEDEHRSLVAKMARYIVFKGGACEPILASKLNEEVMGEYKKTRGLGKQVLAEAAKVVRNTFGLKLVRAPRRNFEQAKYKDSFYLINDITNPNFRGDMLESVNPALRGLLMAVVSLVYCSNHGTVSHKMPEPQLVQHLDKLDPNSSRAARERLFGCEDWETVLDLLCKQHYLHKEKESDNEGSAAVSVLGLGPRAFVELGRKQILFFTHEAVGQAVDQALLDEIAQDDKSDEEQDEEGHEGAGEED